MEKTIRSCKMSKDEAVKAFVKLNGIKVTVDVLESGEIRLVTDEEPKNLIYPAGWYYENGRFTNKRTSTIGPYVEIVMEKINGNGWDVYAGYCTLK